MMMNSVLAFVVLSCIWRVGDCAITAWVPVVSGGASGTATHASEMNTGLTAGDATSVSITATGGASLAHTLVSNTPNTPVFTIDSTTGALTVSSGTVTYVTGTTTAFVFIVSATDVDTTPMTATVTVNINQVPVFSATSGSFCVPVGNSEGYDVTQYAATDGDTGDTLTYAISAGNTGTTFAFVGTSGILQVTTSTALTSGTSYTLTVTVGDGTTPGGTATATATISVETTCSSSSTVALSLMTILAALIVTKLA